MRILQALASEGGAPALSSTSASSRIFARSSRRTAAGRRRSENGILERHRGDSAECVLIEAFDAAASVPPEDTRLGSLAVYPDHQCGRRHLGEGATATVRVANRGKSISAAPRSMRSEE